MAIPIKVAAAAYTLGRNRAFQGAAGAVGATRIYKTGKFVGSRHSRKQVVGALKEAGVKGRRNRARAASAAVKPPSTLGGQAAAVATSVPGSAAIGAAGVAGAMHWKDQPRDAKGRWTR